MYMRIATADPEKFDMIKDFLSGKGIELLASETEDPLELVMFYLSRMNSKLDNLGQLRHLVKIEKSLASIKTDLDLFARLVNVQLDKERSSQILSSAYYESLRAQSGFDPNFKNPGNLTIEQIDVIFEQRLVFGRLSLS